MQTCCSELGRNLCLQLTGTDNKFVQLTWDGSTCLWIGSYVSACGSTLYVCFACFSPYSSCNDFALTFSCSPPSVAPCCSGNNVACPAPDPPCTCSPFVWKQGTVLPCSYQIEDTNCAGPCSDGTLLVGATITEGMCPSMAMDQGIPIKEVIDMQATVSGPYAIPRNPYRGHALPNVTVAVASHPVATVATAAEPEKVKAPCAHLGSIVGEVRCGPCGGKVMIKTMACKVFGQCTPVKKVTGVACCVGCPSYLTPPDPI